MSNRNELRKLWKNSMASIVEDIEAMAKDENKRDEIIEGALSVEVRSGWQNVGETLSPTEFCILLGTGGPAVRIVGELSPHMEPESADLQVQDWGTPWTSFGHMVTSKQREALLQFVSCFYFGE